MAIDEANTLLLFVRSYNCVHQSQEELPFKAKTVIIFWYMCVKEREIHSFHFLRELSRWTVGCKGNRAELYSDGERNHDIRANTAD